MGQYNLILIRHKLKSIYLKSIICFNLYLEYLIKCEKIAKFPENIEFININILDFNIQN